MRNKNNCVACFSKFFKLNEQLVSFLRSKNSCRLIKYQYVGTSVKSLEYFNLLLDSYRKFLYLFSDIHFKIIFLGNLLGKFNSFIHIYKRSAFFRFCSKNNIFSNSQRRNKHKMLMYHSYTFFYSILRRLNCSFSAV
ncbi:hypothetical protein DSECCO2_661040 [anaerobic digester metagenome]